MERYTKMMLIISVITRYQSSILRLDCKSYADFSISIEAMADSGSVLKELTSKTRRQCCLECISTSACKSINYKSNELRCQLIDRGMNSSLALLVKKDGWVYMTTNDEERDIGPICKELSPCEKGTCIDTCNTTGYRCICDKYYYGETCTEPIQDCTAVYKSGSRQDGVYNIYISRPGLSMDVFCDMTTNNEGWIVIQRRVNNSVDFYRDWQAYKEGFGNIRGNFWIGLDKLHMLAGPDRRAILRVDLKHMSKPGTLYYAEYTTFEIGNEEEKYKLLIGGYSGNAGDSMALHNKMKFTTRDRDYDVSSIENCAVRWRGAWWYKKCHRANLNGIYPTNSSTSPIYMSWYQLFQSFGKIIFSEMKIKYF